MASVSDLLTLTVEQTEPWLAIVDRRQPVADSRTPCDRLTYLCRRATIELLPNMRRNLEEVVPLGRQQ